MTDIRAFLESYRACWEAVIKGSAPISALTPFFHPHCFMVSADGGVRTIQSATEIEDFNIGRRDSFQEGGVARCGFRGVDTISQGPHTTLAVVNWELSRSDGTLERAWRHYYTIAHGADTPRILVSAFQTGAGQ